jgi:hypothetical protein
LAASRKASCKIVQSKNPFKANFLKELSPSRKTRWDELKVNKTKGNMDTQQNPNEPANPNAPGQQGSKEQDSDKQAPERQQREREEQGGSGQSGGAGQDAQRKE